MSEKKSRNVTLYLVVAITTLISLIACKPQAKEVIIRLGIPNNASGVAPIILVEKLNLLKQYAPSTKLELTVIESSMANNEAFITNKIDAAAINNTNFLIGSEKGIPYKIFSTLSYGSTSIQTNDPDRIKSFADITKNDKIVLISPSGSSAFLVYLASKKYFGSYNALENNIVVMDIASGESAFINRLSNITLYSPSFLGSLRTRKAGAVTILEERDLFENGLVNWNLVVSNVFYEKHQEIMKGLYSALQDAIALIESKDEQAINIITERDGIEREIFLENLELGYFKYVLNDFSSLKIVGDIAFEIGLISSKPDFSNLIFESSPALH